MVKKERVIAYIDGFNLYFGMLDAGLMDYKWLNIRQLVQNLVKETQELVAIKYFTSKVTNDPAKTNRQRTYIEALESVGVDVIYGLYQSDTIECRKCFNKWIKFNEKMTDVNIATHILIDAYEDKYDAAMLISGDSDLVPPIKAIHENFHDKRVFVAFPPNRYNNSVKINAKGSLIIGNGKIKSSQFPEKVLNKWGYELLKPNYWKPSN